MDTRAFAPTRLAVDAFAAEGGTLDGVWPLASFERLASSTLPPLAEAASPGVTWSARGERRSARGGSHETWLGLHAHAELVLECQRCLSPMPCAIDLDREFRFVDGEDAAAQLDAEDEAHDVLATPRALDLHELLEDELILALPIVPRHEVCPAPLVAEDLPGEALANPFAALVDWKRREPPD